MCVAQLFLLESNCLIYVLFVVVVFRAHKIYAFRSSAAEFSHIYRDCKYVIEMRQTVSQQSHTNNCETNANSDLVFDSFSVVFSISSRISILLTIRLNINVEMCLIYFIYFFLLLSPFFLSPIVHCSKSWYLYCF